MKSIQRKYPYFWILAEINTKFNLNHSLDNVRIKNEKDLSYLNSILKHFFKIYIKSNNNIDKLIALLSVTGITLYYQPFYDGNSRTLKCFISIILRRLGYDYTFNSKDFIIPMLYDEEEATVSDLIKLQKIIKNWAWNFLNISK